MNTTIDLADGAYNRLQRIFSKIHSTPLDEPLSAEQIGDLKVLTQELWDNLINKQFKHALISVLLPGDSNALLGNIDSIDIIEKKIQNQINRDQDRLKNIIETHEKYKINLAEQISSDLEMAKERKKNVNNTYNNEKQIKEEIKELLKSDTTIQESKYKILGINHNEFYLKNPLTGELESYFPPLDNKFLFEKELTDLDKYIDELEKLCIHSETLDANNNLGTFNKIYEEAYNINKQIELVNTHIDNRKKMHEVVQYLKSLKIDSLDFKNIDSMTDIKDFMLKIDSLIKDSQDRLNELEKYNNKQHLINVENKLLAAFETGNAEMRKVLALLDSEEFANNKNSYKYYVASFFMGAVIAALSMPALLVINFITFMRPPLQVINKTFYDAMWHPNYGNVLLLPVGYAAAVGISLVASMALSIAYSLAQAISIIAYLPKAALHADMKENEVYNRKIQLIESLSTLEKLFENLNVFSNEPNKKWQGIPPAGITENDLPSLLQLFEKTIKTVFSPKQCEKIKDVLKTYVHIDINRAAKTRLSAIDGLKKHDPELTQLLKEHFNHRFSSLELKLYNCKKEPSKSDKDEIKKLETDISTLERDFKSIISALKKQDIATFCEITRNYLDKQQQSLQIINNEQQNVSSLTFSKPQTESSSDQGEDGNKSKNKQDFEDLKQQLKKLEQESIKFNR